MAVDRCRDGHRSGELLQPLSFALLERPDRKFAPRQRPAGDRIGSLELVSQMPHRSAIARLSGDMKN
jgi:hypothetical protein